MPKVLKAKAPLESLTHKDRIELSTYPSLYGEVQHWQIDITEHKVGNRPKYYVQAEMVAITFPAQEGKPKRTIRIPFLGSLVEEPFAPGYQVQVELPGAANGVKTLKEALAWAQEYARLIAEKSGVLTSKVQPKCTYYQFGAI